MTITIPEKDIKQAIVGMLLKTTGNRVRAEQVEFGIEQADGSHRPLAAWVSVIALVEVETKEEP